jgi:isopenicillin-N epimerase
MKENWLLDPSVAYLNHGSFGAAPRVVLEKQQELQRRMEKEPVLFLVRELEPLMDAVRTDLGRLIGATLDDLAYVPNATSGVNAVLRSLEFTRGDELLVTTQEYNACRNVLDYIASRSGARVKPIDIPFPIRSPQQVIDAVMGSVTSATRLLLIDHITSQTALIMPVQQIVAELNARGIDTIIDGAHVAGQIPVNIREIGCAYYTGNLHKWVCAPKGAAFLYVREDRREGIHPIVISHGLNSTRTDRSRFHLEFDWPGTFDPTAFLAAGESLRFIPSLVPGGWPEIMRRNHELALRARDILCRALKIDPPAPDHMLASMAAVPVPDGKPGDKSSVFGDPLQDALFDQFRIEVPVAPWPSPPKRLLRISAQLYNSIDEYSKLADALGRLL